MNRISPLLMGAACAVTATVGEAEAQPQTLNAQDADIRAFIAEVSRQTGRTFIIDPRVKGTVSIYSEGAFNDSQLFEVLLSTLRANGLSAVPTSGGAYIIAPNENGGQLTDGAVAAGFVTQVFRLKNVNASTAAESVRPFIGRQGQVIANANSNTLVVADQAPNLKRIRAIIEGVDEDVSTVRTITLRNLSAREVTTVLEKLTGSSGDQAARFLTVVPLAGSNSIVLRGEQATVERYAAIVDDIDARAQNNTDVRVVHLQHANAEQLLPVLQQLVGQLAPPQGNAAGADAQSAPVSGGQGPKIARYPGANALIISADAATQRRLDEVIRQVDIRREQVLVEAIVVEVSDTAAKELGVQFILSGQKGGDTPLLATNFSDRAPNLLALTGAVVGQNSSNSNDDATQEALGNLRDLAITSLLASTGGIAGFAGNINDDALFGFIVNAVKRDTGSNLLSTPSVMTLDNQEASILVGQEVPVSTGQVLSSNNDNPFRTVERREIGIKLGVKPQINAGGSITLLLTQEVSTIAPGISNGIGDLVFNKRQIQTTVLVDDGEIVALGGLLDQNETITADRVPILGDIPGLGRLFRNQRRTKDKTNLMVFLRPRIVRDAEEARQIAAERYQSVRDLQIKATHGDSSLEETIRDYMRTTPPEMKTVAPPAAQDAAKPAAPAQPAKQGRHRSKPQAALAPEPRREEAQPTPKPTSFHLGDPNERRSSALPARAVPRAQPPVDQDSAYPGSFAGAERWPINGAYLQPASFGGRKPPPREISMRLTGGGPVEVDVGGPVMTAAPVRRRPLVGPAP